MTREPPEEERSSGGPRLQPLAGHPDPRQGERVAERYVVESLLAAGAAGALYRGRDVETGRPVTIRFVEPAQPEDHDEQERRRRETEALLALRHPHIASLLDRGQAADGTPFLISEVTEGVSLRDLLATEGERLASATADPARLGPRIGTSQPPPDEGGLRLVVRWAAQLASALGTAHEHGVYHRDVRPSHVVIDRQWQAVLVNFGVAVRGGEDQLAASPPIGPTACYMAPEQASGEARSSAALDVYACSATLYHMLAGRPPFVGSPDDVLRQVITGAPAPLWRVRPTLPKELIAIVDKGMEREPARRYQTAAELEVDLRAFLNHLPVSVPVLSPTALRWREAQRHPRRTALRALTALLVMAVVIGVPLWLWRRSVHRAVTVHALEAGAPPFLAVEGTPAQRLEIPELELRQDLALVRRLRDLGASDLRLPLEEAALLLDLGMPHDAASVMTAFAEHHPSDYTTAVAARYRALPDSAKGADALDLTPIEAKSANAVDFLVQGFHVLRRRDRRGFFHRADNLLRAAGRDLAEARDLRLISMLASAEQAGDEASRRRLLEDALAEAAALENEEGVTARTAATRGIALAELGRPAEALMALQASSTLAPERYSTLLATGVALRQLRRLDEAERTLARAALLRPQQSRAPLLRAVVLLDLGKLGDAYEVADAVPPPEWSQSGWRREVVLGEIAVWELVQRYAGGQTGEALAPLLERATGHVDAAQKELKDEQQPPSDRLLVLHQIIKAVADDDREHAAAHLLMLLADRAQTSALLHIAIELLPDGPLDAATGRAAQALLRRFQVQLDAQENGTPLPDGDEPR